MTEAIIASGLVKTYPPDVRALEPLVEVALAALD